MALFARTITNSLGDISVFLEGDLEIENCVLLKKELLTVVKRNPASRIILDFEQVEFVGASGIGHLVDIVQTLVKGHRAIGISNLPKEFIRVFQLYNFDPVSYLVEEFKLESERNPPTTTRQTRRQGTGTDVG